MIRLFWQIIAIKMNGETVLEELVKKHEMTEEDIKLRYITPAIESKWDKHTQIRMEQSFTDGRVIVRGNFTARGKKKKADYILYYKRNLPLAIIEAKDNKQSVGAGMQQSIEYADILDISANEAPSRARKIVKTGDILYSTVRPYLHNMCIINRGFSHTPIVSTGFAVIACYQSLYNRYLFYYLLSPDFDNYVNHIENSKGVAYPAINDTRLYNALVPVPPHTEQYRIVMKCDELMKIIEIMERFSCNENLKIN